MEFQVNERVRIGPDFSNDDFEPFEAVIFKIEDDFYYVRDDEGEESFWMSGNVFKL